MRRAWRPPWFTRSFATLNGRTGVAGQVAKWCVTSVRGGQRDESPKATAVAVVVRQGLRRQQAPFQALCSRWRVSGTSNSTGDHGRALARPAQPRARGTRSPPPLGGRARRPRASSGGRLLLYEPAAAALPGRGVCSTRTSEPGEQPDWHARRIRLCRGPSAPHQDAGTSRALSRRRRAELSAQYLRLT